MFSLYMLLLVSILYSVNKMMNWKYLVKDDKEILNFLLAAFFGGFFVVLSNWQEDHFFVMFTMYIAVYKVYYWNKKFQC